MSKEHGYIRHLRSLGLSPLFKRRRMSGRVLDERIAEIVELHGSLPLAFREFLRAFGSQPTSLDQDVVFDAPRIGALSPEVFFALLGDEGSPAARSLSHELLDARNGGLPHGLLPFAEDGAGSLYCLDSRSEGVIYWDHGKKHALAPSLPEFFALLRIDDSVKSVPVDDGAVVTLKMAPPPLSSIRGRKGAADTSKGTGTRRNARSNAKGRKRT